MNRTLLVLGTILRMAILHPALALPAGQIQGSDTPPKGPRIGWVAPPGGAHR